MKKGEKHKVLLDAKRKKRYHTICNNFVTFGWGLYGTGREEHHPPGGDGPEGVAGQVHRHRGAGGPHPAVRLGGGYAPEGPLSGGGEAPQPLPRGGESHGPSAAVHLGLPAGGGLGPGGAVPAPPGPGRESGAGWRSCTSRPWRSFWAPWSSPPAPWPCRCTPSAPR